MSELINIYNNTIQPNEYENKNLSLINISDTVIYIGYRAFQNNKIKNLIIPDSVEEIGYEAFAGNDIEILKLSEKLKLIDKSVFSDNKIKTLEIPEKIKIIGRTAFQKNKITELILPENVREIHTGAFWENYIINITISPHVNIIKGEYDDFPARGGTFGFFGGSFLDLYESNGSLGGEYTYNKKTEKWDFVEIPLKRNSSLRIWSEETRKYTEESLKNLEFGINKITKNVSMKREDGSFGYIEIGNALNNIYTVVSEDDTIEHFNSVKELTKAGWILD